MDLLNNKEESGDDAVRVIRLGYGRCTTCNYVVKLDGHEERCRVSNEASLLRKEVRENGWSIQKLHAWVNDAVLCADVRLGVLKMGIPDKELSSRADSYKSNEYIARYWLSLKDTSHLAQPSGSSDHNVGTAFECNYKGKFREEFLTAAFGVDIAKEIMLKIMDIVI